MVAVKDGRMCTEWKINWTLCIECKILILASLKVSLWMKWNVTKGQNFTLP